jgi:hypothetical protein
VLGYLAPLDPKHVEPRGGIGLRLVLRIGGLADESSTRRGLPSATTATNGALIVGSIGFGLDIFVKNSTNAALPVGTFGLCWM